ncbi:MAG: hypothetical protein CM15mP21_1830 [Hyphomicrobiales bacterium]|nr:MAG: hypothetical protein CM15mP21_1830 [Hyphomicrobiales bacterium]
MTCLSSEPSSGGVRAARMSAGYGARVAREFRVAAHALFAVACQKLFVYASHMPNCSKKPAVLVGVSAQPNLTGHASGK